MPSLWLSRQTVTWPCAIIVVVILWLNGPFGVGKTSAADALLQRMPGALLFDPEPFGTALRHALLYAPIGVGWARYHQG